MPESAFVFLRWTAPRIFGRLTAVILGLSGFTKHLGGRQNLCQPRGAPITPARQVNKRAWPYHGVPQGMVNKRHHRRDRLASLAPPLAAIARFGSIRWLRGAVDSSRQQPNVIRMEMLAPE